MAFGFRKTATAVIKRADGRTDGRTDGWMDGRRDGWMINRCLIFLLLCMFRSLYSVYCLCVNVCCTAAAGFQPNCG
jgi:hypothetical protein